MFRSKSSTKPSEIPSDVADLINELDSVAAPFDESMLVERSEDDDMIIVEEHRPYSTLDEDSPIATNMRIDEDQDPDVKNDCDSPLSELSMQACDMSVDQLEEELLLLENTIQDARLDESKVHHASFGDLADRIGVRPGFFVEAPINTIKVDPPKQEATEEGFNPFVNIGNRLLDTQDTPSQDKNDDDKPPVSPTLVYKVVSGSVSILKTTAKTVKGAVTLLLQLLLGLLQVLSFCLCNLKVVAPVMMMLAAGLLLAKSGWATYVHQDEATADTFVEQADATADIVVDIARNTSIFQDLYEQVQSAFIHQNEEMEPTIIHQDEEMETTFIEEATKALLDIRIPLEFQLPWAEHTLGLFKMLAFHAILIVVVRSLVNRSSSVKTEARATKDERARYESLTIPQLKQELSSRGLFTTGAKSHLVDRLVDNDKGGSVLPPEIADYNVAATSKAFTLVKLKSELRARSLPYQGLKDELIVKVWIPARRKELQLCKRDDLRKMLKRKKLGQGGLKDDLVRRLIEAGH